MTKEISNCKCGGNNSGIDWLPVTQVGSVVYQTCMIQCVNCDVDVSININADTAERKSDEYKDKLIELWNLINK